MPPNCSIAGVLWVIEEAGRTGKPSVASMSLGGGPSDALDKAVLKVCAEWMKRDDDTTHE